MLKQILPIAMFLAIGAGVAAYATATTRSERPDCPGKIVCPLSGELVCKDLCPIEENRSDCPGKITCPLTGELVCKDRCPIDFKEENTEKTVVPSCCLQ